MRRATITIPDDLEHELNKFMTTQDTPPSLTNIMQSALRHYLDQRKWSQRNYRAAKQPLVIPAADKGSGKNDISAEHDKYL